jgi:hypothetical protein
MSVQLSSIMDILLFLEACFLNWRFHERIHALAIRRSVNSANKYNATHYFQSKAYHLDKTT